MSRAHRDPLYQRRAKLVRAAAYANPTTRCWRCGRTLAEHRRRWHAGHVIEGDNSPTGPLAPECEPCNLSHGAAYGNRMRNANRLEDLMKLQRQRQSRQW